MQLALNKPIGNDATVASCGMATHCLAFLVMSLTIGPAFAESSQDLVNLINDYRSKERSCDGRLMSAVGPVAVHAGLSNVQIAVDGDLWAALTKQDYLPASVQLITISGPDRASSAMALIKRLYCRPVLDSAYADIGVSREGDTWRIVLARPVLSPDLPDWPDAGKEILRLTNQARAEARSCGRKQFGAAPALTWAPELAGASLVHSRDMAGQNYFRHRAKDGSRAGERVGRSGYAWRRVGENIASGQGSAEQTVSAWVSSPPHCANLMNPHFTEMGAAYAIDAKSDSTIYWTQVFATPR